MWSGFKKRIYEKLPTTELPLVQGKSFTSEKSMTGQEIIEKYNIIHFSIEEVAGILLDKISKQPKGEEGELLTNGYSNVFYCKDTDGSVFSAYAFWYAVVQKWYCFDRVLAFGWSAGLRFWSRNGNSVALSTQTLESSDSLTDEVAIKHLKENGYKIIKEF